MKALRLPALALLLLGATVVVVAGNQLTHPAGPAAVPQVSSAIPATATPAPVLNTSVPPVRAARPTPTAVLSTSAFATATRSAEPTRANTLAPTATATPQPMTGTGVSIVKRAIAAMHSSTSCHFLIMSTHLDAEGDLINSHPPREVDTITEHKNGAETQRTIMIIGDSAWDYKDGQWVTHPTGFLDPLSLSAVCQFMLDDVTVADSLGDTILNGRAVYHLAVTYSWGRLFSSADAWIDTGTYYPYLLEGHNGDGNDRIDGTIKFSRFNDPAIKIEPPTR